MPKPASSGSNLASAGTKQQDSHCSYHFCIRSIYVYNFPSCWLPPLSLFPTTRWPVGAPCFYPLQSDYSVFIDVESATSKVVVKGVREDVETAAEKIREISHEFRTTEERFLVQPHQVCPSAR